MKCGLQISDLHYFSVRELLDYWEFHIENEKQNHNFKSKTKQGKTYEGGQGALDFLRGQK